ncbi:MAG: hypothetical protein K1X75_14880 [Leptospirales bacterium]|nr:hypothetical protein [Leptospirales bacterium]
MWHKPIRRRLSIAMLALWSAGCFLDDADCSSGDATCSIQAALAASLVPDIVFVALSGTNAFFSYNGRSWNGPIATGSPAGLADTAYGNGRYVAVGLSGSLVHSTDLVNWTVGASGTSNNLNGVTFGGGHFVATGASGTVLISFDGINWSLQSPGAAVGLTRPFYGGGLFAAAQAGASTNYFSPGGLTGTWGVSTRTVSVFGYTTAYGNNRWIFGSTGSDVEVFSSDLKTAIFASASAVGSCNGQIYFAGDRFFCTGDNGDIYYTVTGMESSWSGGALGCMTGGAGELIRGVAYSNGLYVAAGDDIANNGAICTSASGVAGSFTRVTVNATALPLSALEVHSGPLRLGFR